MKYDKELFVQQLSGARTLLALAMPFYSSLLQHLRVYASDVVPTAAVTGDDRLLINPEFFDALPGQKQRAFLLAHEVLHPALGIFWRGQGHHPVLSNHAHDYVINLILTDDNKEWFIEGGLLNEGFRGMCYEEVYAKLVQQAKDMADKSGGIDSAVAEMEGGKGQFPMRDIRPDLGGSGSGDEADKGMRPVDGVGEPGSESRAQVWAQRVIAADLTAKAQGKQSLGAARALGLIGQSTVPWTEVLRLAVAEKNHRSRLDWSRPSRRSGALGYFAPREEMLGSDCTIYVDTSGSISAENLQSAVSEIAEIMHQAGGKIRWLEGDAEILRDEWINQSPETLDGGGGTSFVPLFEHLRDSPTKLLVIFTDTWGAMPDFVPSYPVIWAVYAANNDAAMSREVPFGEIIAVPEHAFV